jgi:hypothetical protein
MSGRSVNIYAVTVIPPFDRHKCIVKTASLGTVSVEHNERLLRIAEPTIFTEAIRHAKISSAIN